MSAVSWTGETRASEDAELTAEQIDVYVVSPESVTDDEILDNLTTVLDEQELTRWRQFAFAGDRHDFLISHALIRFVLSRYAGVHPAAWRFRTNRFGRPEIASPSVAEGLRFNLSHTSGLIAVAVGRERNIGIDVENTTRELPIEAAALILSPTEISRVRSMSDERKRERLFALWTLKAAYAKGRGLGVSLPLSEFSFDFDESPTEIILASETDAEPGRWLFELHQPSPIHCLALAYDAAKYARAKVRMVPLISQIGG